MPKTFALTVLLAALGFMAWQPDARADDLPYTAVESVNIYQVLAPFPKEGTPAGNADMVGAFAMLAKPGTVEWQEARDDAAVDGGAMLLNYFTAGIFDAYIADNAPATVKLLDRVTASVAKPVRTAKDYFNRPRPFRTLKLQTTCDETFGPQAGPEVGLHDSYPSGHSARGWATALTLVEIAPEQARDWLARGQEFGESRVACGVHYPSDVAAGRLLAAAALDKLRDDEAFRIDLGAARLEFQRLRQQN